MEKINKTTTKTLSPFQKIYQVVSKIPKGFVMTYKQVSIVAGVKNARVVGFAMRSNKDTTHVPCHRVVSSDGQLRGYAYGGIKRKQELLEHEGITFIQDGVVDLERYQYQN